LRIRVTRPENEHLGAMSIEVFSFITRLIRQVGNGLRSDTIRNLDAKASR